MTHDSHSLAMTRLFDRGDLEFLRGMPGYTRRSEAEFRRGRRRIFRAYLASVRAEFLEVAAEIQELAQQCHQGQEFAWMLLRYRVQLAAAMMAAQLRLLRYRWDMGTVQLADVVQRFDAILSELRQWVPEAE